jgi:hypothetical protein
VPREDLLGDPKPEASFTKSLGGEKWFEIFWGRDPQMARAGLTLARSVPACSYLVRFERLAEGRAAVLSSHRALLRSSHLLL